MGDPLAGVRVLDLSCDDPGAFCTLLMADFGADVLRIDPLRSIGSFGWAISPTDEGRAAEFAINRNKKSMALDLKKETARRVFYRLASEADILVEGFRPGVTKRLGVDYDQLRVVNPRLVYCSISGYGQHGVHRELPGHDVNYISASGIQSFIRDRSANFALPLNLIGDYSAGALYAAIGILLAYRAAEKQGTGQHIDISMTDACFSLLCFALGNPLVSESLPAWKELETSGLHPWYRLYRAKDRRWLSIACSEPHFVRNLCQALGRPELAEREESEVTAEMEMIFASRSRDEWFEFLKDRNVCVAKVNSLGEAIREAEARETAFIEVPVDAGSTVRQPSTGIRLSGTPARFRKRAPTFGEDTTEVLLGLDYGAEAIRKMHQEGAIYAADLARDESQ